MFARNACSFFKRSAASFSSKVGRYKVKPGQVLSFDLTGNGPFYKVTERATRNNGGSGYGDTWDVWVMREYCTMQKKMIKGGSKKELLIGFAEFGEGDLLLWENEDKKDTPSPSMTP